MWGPGSQKQSVAINETGQVTNVQSTGRTKQACGDNLEMCRNHRCQHDHVDITLSPPLSKLSVCFGPLQNARPELRSSSQRRPISLFSACQEISWENFQACSQAGDRGQQMAGAEQGPAGLPVAGRGHRSARASGKSASTRSSGRSRK